VFTVRAFAYSTLTIVATMTLMVAINAVH